MPAVAGRLKRAKFPRGKRVKVQYGDRVTDGVVTGTRAGLIAVDLKFLGSDEPVHALFRADEIGV